MTRLHELALRIPSVRRLHDERNDMLAQLASSERRQLAQADSVFFHYAAAFDALEVIRRHAVPGVRAHADYLTNFLGVKIKPAFLPDIIGHMAGQIDIVPIPANWHADIAEWAASLRALDLAVDGFTMVELGCGWGCWMNNTGVAARRAGLKVRLIGVESDAAHLEFARQACAINDFAEHSVTLHHGVAAAVGGVALFPRQITGGLHWGLQPIFGMSDSDRATAIGSGNFDEVAAFGFNEIASGHDRIDLLHMDIQGGEADFIEGCLETCTAKVAYLVVGTHSREIEGRLMSRLQHAGWLLEIERPAIFTIVAGAPQLRIDGVQGWRNPGLIGDRALP